jgi:hypothetical protein
MTNSSICNIDKKSFLEALIDPIIRPLHSYLVNYWFQSKWDPKSPYFPQSIHFRRSPNPSADHMFEVGLGRKIMEWLVNIDLVPWPLSNTDLLFDHITGISFAEIMWMSWNLLPPHHAKATSDAANSVTVEGDIVEAQKIELAQFQKCVHDVVFRDSDTLEPLLANLLIQPYE